jgi:hypothetical protein
MKVVVISHWWVRCPPAFQMCTSPASRMTAFLFGARSRCLCPTISDLLLQQSLLHWLDIWKAFPWPRPLPARISTKFARCRCALTHGADPAQPGAVCLGCLQLCWVVLSSVSSHRQLLSFCCECVLQCPYVDGRRCCWLCRDYCL